MDNKILETIKNNQVRMRPRWHFILRAALMMVGGVILLFLLVYLISFIIFVERQSESAFLITLPWFLVLLSIVFIGLLEILVCRYAFAYRQPLLYSLFGVIAIIAIGSFIVLHIGFHQRFARYAEREHLPLAPGFYRIYLPRGIR